MAGLTKSISASSDLGTRYPNSDINITGPLHLSSQPVSHSVESNELVDLIYGSSSQATSSASFTNSISAPIVPNVSQETELEKTSSATSSSYLYKCDRCDREFDKASCFAKHKRAAFCRYLNSKGKNKRKPMTKCKKVPEKKSRATEFKPYECGLCGAKFLDKGNSELHLERAHNTRQPLWIQASKTVGAVCPDCNIWFSDKHQLHDHQQQEHRPEHPNMNHLTQHTNDSSLFQTPMAQQPMPPPPPPSHQYYFQPIHHINPYTSNHIHQYAPSHQQIMSPMPPVCPQQGHAMQPVMMPQPSNQLLTPLPQSPTVSGSVQTLNSPGLIPSSNSSETGKNSKVNKTYSSSNGVNSRKNVCGECGMKFVDPINVELHMQRKHPSSNIIDTVDVGNGIYLFKTSSSDKSGKQSDSQANLCNNSKKSKSNITYNRVSKQVFGCALCDFEMFSIAKVIQHLQTVHNTCNANFINVLTKKCYKSNSKYISSKVEDECQIHKYHCDSCFIQFNSRPELIDHMNKDKNVLCGLCQYSSCSRAKVSAHMDSFHKELADFSPSKINPNSTCDGSNLNFSANETFLSSESDSPNVTTCSLSPSELLSCSKDDESNLPRLRCCMCSFIAGSGVSLAQHLESHGSIQVKCGKCEQSSSSFVDISNHISCAHAGEFTRVSITMTASQSSSVYMFMISPAINPDRNSDITYCDGDSISYHSSFENKAKNDQINGKKLLTIYANNTPLYVCSKCRECVVGSKELNVHFKMHLRPPSDNYQAQGKASSNSHCETYDESLNDKFKISPLTYTTDTTEYSCKECGYWSECSDKVLNHIREKHLSGEILHIINAGDGTETLCINVCTPVNENS